MAKTHIQVDKNQGETNAALLRRFSKKVQETRLLKKIKADRYYSRKASKLNTKLSALKKMGRRTEIERLKKLGKMA